MSDPIKLVVISGPPGCGKSLQRAELLKKLPAGSKFSVHEWPWHTSKRNIERDLKDGLFVFVETQESDLSRFPVKPYRLITMKRQRAQRRAG